MKNNYLKNTAVKFHWLCILAFSVFCLGTSKSAKAQDIGITALVFPFDTICGTTNYSIVFTLQNYDTAAIDFSLNNVTFVVDVSGASTQFFTFTLNSGTLNSFTDQSVTVTSLGDFSAGGNHTIQAYAMTANDFNNSNDTLPASNVFVKPSPFVNGEPNSSICAGTAMSAFSFTSNPPGATFTWSNDQPSVGLAASGTGDRPSFTTINTTDSLIAANITVQATLDGCLGASLGYMIQVQPLPSVSAGSNQTTCVGNSLNFAATTTNAVAYFWDFGDGGSSTTLNPTHAYSTFGTYNVILTATSSAGCTAGDTIQITVNGAPTLTVTSTINPSCNSLCDGMATVSASGGFSPYAYFWSPSGATTTTSTGLCAGTYTVTVTDMIGCSSNTFVTLTDPLAINANLTSGNATCNGACDGYASMSPTGGIAPYTYNWSPGGATTAVVTGLCPGSFNAAITDMNGCTTSSNFIITQPSALNVIAGPAQTICSTASAFIYGIPSGGSAPYTYSWSDGFTNFSTSDSITVTPTSTTVYIITVTDASGCTGAATDTIMIAANTNINGNVTYSGGNLSSGVNTAILFKTLSTLAIFDTVATTTIDGSGNYNFSFVELGDYLVKIFPDTFLYPMTVPTYYGNHYLWDSASVISHGCSVSNTADIILIEADTAGGGPGFISGTVLEGIGFGRAPGGPVPGIDIKLGRNPGGQLVINTQTDSNGDYTFTNIPVGSYKIFVDIPGIGRDSSYRFAVTATNNQFINLDYAIDSATVRVQNSVVGIINPSAKENKFNVYPNPSKGAATIEYTVQSDTKVTLAVYNVLGIKVMDVLNSRQSAGTYKYSLDVRNNNLNSGIYFITLVKDGKVSTQRLVITE